jgi:hypothetical protein
MDGLKSLQVNTKIVVIDTIWELKMIVLMLTLLSTETIE